MNQKRILLTVLNRHRPGAGSIGSCRRLCQAPGADPFPRCELRDVSAALVVVAVTVDMICAQGVVRCNGDPDRSVDPAELAQAAQRIAPALAVDVVPDARQALRAARERTAPGELLCVTGSVYLAGIARSLFDREASALGN